MAVLTSSSLTGCSAIPGFIASGTLMLFQQSAAPSSWTKESTHNDKSLRVVTGNVSPGGSTAFSSVFASRSVAGNISVAGSAGQNSGGGSTGQAAATTGSGSATTGQGAGGQGSATTGSGSASTGNASASGTVGNTTLSTPQIPSHSHTTGSTTTKGCGNPPPTGQQTRCQSDGTGNTANAGGGGQHSHPFSGSSHSHPGGSHTHPGGQHTHPQHTHPGGSHTHPGGQHTHPFSGAQHTHPVSITTSSFSGTSQDFDVNYVDIIICSKD